MKKLLVLISLGLVSCQYEPEPKKNPTEIFENLWETFYNEYAPFEERGVDWEVLYDEYRAKVSNNTSDEELYGILSEMLAHLDDGHVTLTAPGKPIFNSNKILREKVDDELFRLEVVKSYLESKKEGDGYFYGKVKGEDIAYIYFEHVAENFFVLPSFLDDFPNVKGYVIDLRHNEGGDFTYSFSELGRFTDKKVSIFKSKTKNGRGTYTDWHEWSVFPKGDYVNTPVVVLTDRYTISAGERTVMALREFPTVTVVGDTTSGAHGTMIGRELANGWFYSLVPQKVLMSDQKSYEGIGIAPDIRVINSKEDLNQGIENTLDYSIKYINEAKNR
jgi:carboxyl-terminal processing protease